MRKYFLSSIIILCVLITGCAMKSPQESVHSNPEKIKLTLAIFQDQSFFAKSDLGRWVKQYCETCPEVEIEIINYMEQAGDFQEAMNQIKIEINAGKGPDMVQFGQLYSPLEASCGMMADLRPFMKSDEIIDENDYYQNVLDSFAVGDSLYVLVPSFQVNTFTTTNSDLRNLDRMNINQLVDAYDSLDTGRVLFPGETKKSVFGMLCYGSLGNYIDWDEGSCDFNSDRFKQLLIFANQFPLNLNLSEDYSVKNVLTEGNTLLFPVTIDTVYETAALRTLYGETPNYIGYPFNSGNGNMAAIMDIAIGISSTSSHKEEAWIFLRGMLESEFQDEIENGLPVRVDAFEKKLEAAMLPEYDENGNTLVKKSYRFEGEEPLPIYEISEEDANTLRGVIRSIDSPATVDENLYCIMLDEVDYMFNDDRDVNEVADKIQNRASIYIQENK